MQKMSQNEQAEDCIEYKVKLRDSEGHYNVTFVIIHFVMNALGYWANLMMPFVKVAKKKAFHGFVCIVE